ncbi:MAG TPA: hypothetical protein PK759_05985 [Spirochaetales bacterium]|nr:hypothetical protein [Spirochaetales bacterium]HPS15333.1 hypothetical protein [Spirochaetales bacterium]
MRAVSDKTGDKSKQSEGASLVGFNKAKSNNHVALRHPRLKLSTKFLVGFCVANALALIGMAIVINTAH